MSKPAHSKSHTPKTHTAKSQFAKTTTQKSNPQSSKKSPQKPTKPHLYGTHAVRAVFETRPTDILTLFVAPNDKGQTDNEWQTLADTYGISIQKTHKDTLTELCGSSQHQGVVAMVRSMPSYDESILDELIAKPNALFLILDQITDAHNLGACIRTACAMGVDAIIVPKDKSAPLTPTVAKVSVGASELLPVVSVTNLARTISELKKAGVFVFGTALDETARPAHACDFHGKVAIVMGSEGDGIRRLTGELCDTLVYLPMTTKARPQSLNVSVATGMVLYEVARQRGFEI